MQTIEQHNAAVVTRALRERGGKSAVQSLKLYCSDDETVCRVIEKMEGVIHPERVHPSSVVKLAR